MAWHYLPISCAYPPMPFNPLWVTCHQIQGKYCTSSHSAALGRMCLSVCPAAVINTQTKVTAGRRVDLGFIMCGAVHHHGRSGWQEGEAVGPVASRIRKQGATSARFLLLSSISPLCNPGSPPRNMHHLCRWICLPQHKTILHRHAWNAGLPDDPRFCQLDCSNHLR